MLILTHRPGESLRIEPEGAVPTEADPFGWFADGPIRVSVTGVHHGQVRIGIQAPPALRILRDELPPRPADSAPAPLPGRQALARKLKILHILRRWSPESLARLAGLPVATILEIESGWSWASSKSWRGPSGCRCRRCWCRRGGRRRSGFCWRCWRGSNTNPPGLRPTPFFKGGEWGRVYSVCARLREG